VQRYVFQCDCGPYIGDELEATCPKCSMPGVMVKGEQGLRMPFKQAERLVRKLKHQDRQLQQAT